MRSPYFQAGEGGGGAGTGTHLLVGKSPYAAGLVLQAGLPALLHVAHVPQVPHQHPAARSAHNQPVPGHRERVHLSRKTKTHSKPPICQKMVCGPPKKSTNAKTIKKLADQVLKQRY